MKVVSIKIDDFRGPEFCAPKEVELRVGNIYIIKTEFGLDTAKLLRLPVEIKEMKKRTIPELIRIANQDDFKKMQKLEKKSNEAYLIAKEKVKKHNLPMKIFASKYMFDEKRLMFYFTAENRIDFRKLVKDLAAIFKVRIELRQVPQREETRMLGALGICGRELCCASYLKKYENITIKMAKEQNLSLNTIKISGVCGKLLCCLGYEYQTYVELKKNFPKEGTKVKINASDIPRERYIGYNIPIRGEIVGKVRGVNVIRNTVYIEIEDGHIIEVKLQNIRKAGVLNVLK